MSKRLTPSNNAPPTKHAHKLAGFRLARQSPPMSEALGSSSSSKAALFITVNQPDERRVILRAQTHLLSGTPKPLAQSSSSSETPDSYMQTSSHSQHDAGAEVEYNESQPEVGEPESSYRCPTDSCRIPVIPAESSGIRRNQIWQRHQPK